MNGEIRFIKGSLTDLVCALIKHNLVLFYTRDEDGEDFHSGIIHYQTFDEFTKNGSIYITPSVIDLNYTRQSLENVVYTLLISGNYVWLKTETDKVYAVEKIKKDL